MKIKIVGKDQSLFDMLSLVLNSLVIADGEFEVTLVKEIPDLNANSLIVDLDNLPDGDIISSLEETSEDCTIIVVFRNENNQETKYWLGALADLVDFQCELDDDPDVLEERLGEILTHI